MNQEDVFAEEAQEEVAFQGSQSNGNTSKSKPRVSTTEAGLSDDEDNEVRPLMGVPGSPQDQRRPQHRRGHSYQRALDEPWTGAHRAGVLPWYKKPSVSASLFYQVDHTDIMIGVLAASCIFPSMCCVRRHYRAQNIPDSGSDMSRFNVRPFHERPFFRWNSSTVWRQEQSMR